VIDREEAELLMDRIIAYIGERKYYKYSFLTVNEHLRKGTNELLHNSEVNLDCGEQEPIKKVNNRLSIIKKKPGATLPDYIWDIPTGRTTSLKFKTHLVGSTSRRATSKLVEQVVEHRAKKRNPESTSFPSLSGLTSP